MPNTVVESSLPKAERDITLSTFVAQDIRNRCLLHFRFRLSGGQLRHTCRSPAYHVLDQKCQNSLTRLQHVNYLGVYHRIVLTLASVLCISGYVIICAHLTIINVDSAAAF
jgi:hypothetical protein